MKEIVGSSHREKMLIARQNTVEIGRRKIMDQLLSYGVKSVDTLNWRQGSTTEEDTETSEEEIKNAIKNAYSKVEELPEYAKPQEIARAFNSELANLINNKTSIKLLGELGSEVLPPKFTSSTYIRGINALLRSGLKTVGELHEKTDEELMAIRNLGDISRTFVKIAFRPSRKSTSS